MEPTPEKAEFVNGALARLMIQVQMKRRDMGYREFTELLNKTWGLDENERNIRNKIARATFSAGFFLMCMKAFDVTSIDFTSDEFKLPKGAKIADD